MSSSLAFPLPDVLSNNSNYLNPLDTVLQKSNKKTTDEENASSDEEEENTPSNSVQDIIAKHLQINLETNSKLKKPKFNNFKNFKLLDDLLKAIETRGYKYPTPIQRNAIPVALTGRDVVAMARTGSGKSAAFIIPMLQRLKLQHSTTVGVRALILSPTRELAVQTAKFTSQLGKFGDLRVCVIVGGDSFESQFASLTQNPDIIVATPGRLLHVMQETGLSLKRVEYLVFDEADRLFEMGLKHQLLEILKKVPPAGSRQTLLVSATLPSALMDFVGAGLHTPEFIRLDADVKISSTLKNFFFVSKAVNKEATLVYLLRDIINSKKQQTIIFACTRHHCEYISTLLEKVGIRCNVIYGSMEQEARTNSLTAFKNRKCNVLIVTDVAARGIDIPSLDNVINYDFPTKPKLYIHRVGRAGRAGKKGIAYSIVSTDEIPYLLDLHTFLGKPVQIATEAEEELVSSITDEKELYETFDGYCGMIPQAVLDTECQDVNHVKRHDETLQLQFASCESAFKLYAQTRAKPSKASLGKSKEFVFKPNPLVLSQMKNKQGGVSLQEMKNQMDMVEKMKTFRPKETVFEQVRDSIQDKIMKERRNFRQVLMAFKSNHETTKKEELEEEESIVPSMAAVEEEEEEPKTLAQKLLSNRSQRMKQKQSQLQKEGQEEQDEQVDDEWEQIRKKYRDEKFYISSEPQQGNVNMAEEQGYALDNNEEGLDRQVFNNPLRDSVLDLNADENQDMIKQRSVIQWNKKSGKYVKVNLKAGERIDLRGKVRNESGVFVPKDAKSVDVYKKWKSKNHSRIQAAGEEEDSSNMVEYSKTKKRPLETEDSEDRPSKKSKHASELKSKEQLVKEHKQKEKKNMETKIREKIKQKGKGVVKSNLQMSGMIKAQTNFLDKQEKFRKKQQKQRDTNRINKKSRGKK